MCIVLFRIFIFLFFCSWFPEVFVVGALRAPMILLDIMCESPMLQRLAHGRTIFNRRPSAQTFKEEPWLEQ